MISHALVVESTVSTQQCCITLSSRLYSYCHYAMCCSTYQDNKGTSFTTIAGFGPNGAVIHYRPLPETDTRITTDNLFLLDSGGQYL